MAAGWVGMSVMTHRPGQGLALYAVTMVWVWGLFAWAWLRADRFQSWSAMRALLLWGLLFRLCGLWAVPLMEDDYFRYLWDGRQFALTGNPYAQAPAAYFGKNDLSEPWEGILDQINYPHVTTLYGPLVELGFLLSYVIAPGSLGAWKRLLVLAEVLGAGTLVWAFFRPSTRTIGATDTLSLPRGVLILSWLPLGVFETSYNAHPDAIGISLLMVALAAWSKGNGRCCGLACGLAAGARLPLLLIVPFLLFTVRKGWGAFVIALAASYAPFWWQGSWADLPGFVVLAREWEFNSSLYGVVRGSFGVSVARAVCGLTFLGIWGALLWTWIRRRSWPQALREGPPGVAVFGTFLLLSATVNPWYGLWLVPFLAVRPSGYVVAALGLVGLSYATHLNLGILHGGNFDHPLWVRMLEYGSMIGIGVTAWARSHRAGQWPV
jgi:alpha-1,6-mannosyltransferase